MIHGADPWWDIAIRMLIKYQNLRLMTSAWSPKRLPESLLHYMRTRGKNKVIFASDWPVLRAEPRGARGAGPGPAGRRAGQLPLQQRRRTSSSAARRGALTMDRYELRRVDYSLTEDHTDLQAAYQQFFKTPLLDRGRARRRGDRVRQEPVGTVVRHGRHHDGAARVRRRRRRDAGRPDAGGRGDRPVAGAGAVDRPRLRGPAAGATRALDCRRRRRRASRSPGWTRRLERRGAPADSDRFDRRPHHRARRRRRRAADVRHPARQGRQHRPAADGVGGPGAGRQPHGAGQWRRGARGIPTGAG